MVRECKEEKRERAIEEKFAEFYVQHGQEKNKYECSIFFLIIKDFID